MSSLSAVVLLLAGVNPAETPHEPYLELGEELVESLRSGDIIAYAHCWLPVSRIHQLAIASRRPIPGDELKAMGAYFRKRNRQVAHSFHVLADLFEKQGKLSDLTLVDVTIQGDIDERDGLRRVSMFYVKVALGKKQYTITIDDGVEDAGRWFFTDRPLYVERGPTKQVISLEAREDE